VVPVGERALWWVRRYLTDLPDGAEGRVALVDDDELDDDERAKLHAAIQEAEAELDAGQSFGEGELWTRLRAIR
jgi:hypothetical protein